VRDASAPQRLPWIRRPVRREGAERYLLVTLVSFAATVIVTRWFLTLTGFPRIGGGDLHIAHALWGGAALFAAAILPILLAGRFVYLTSALLAGVGIGLFIDEVGKFISAENDYFYPAAAPIIYATFLIAVLVWLRARRPDDPDPRSQLLTALELFEESVEGDLQRGERDDLRERLASAAARAPRAEQRRLASGLLAFLEDEDLRLAPDPVDRFGGLRTGWRARSDRWLGGRGLRMLLIGALLVSGVGQIVALVAIGLGVDFDFSQLMPAYTRFQLVHLVVEGVSGVLLGAGGVLITVAGRHRLGWTLAYFGLLVALTLADLISFYIRQFDSIEVALWHLLLLGAVIAYRHQLRTEPGEREAGAQPAERR
jgi:hypothetical protein